VVLEITVSVESVRSFESNHASCLGKISLIQKDNRTRTVNVSLDFILLPSLQYLSISRKAAKVTIQNPKALLKLKSQKS